MVIGIIVEYNPFHNGHIYHINKIKEKYPDSIIIAVMSGNVTERGDLSIIDKWDKTRIALKYGIDLVIELPFKFASQSADLFARGAMEILNEMKVDKIIFGSECNDINILTKLANIQLSKEYNNLVKDYLDKYNYPTALSLALKKLANTDINSPNDILGMCYIKEIIKNNYNIQVESIKRTNDYNSKELNEIASATSIRNAIKSNIDISKYVPAETIKYINNNLDLDNYFDLIKYKILSTNDLTYIHGIDEKIAPRLKNGILNSNNLEELINNIKIKKYSYNRIKRLLIYILFDYTKKEHNHINYIRILGFNKQGQEYLSKIKKGIKLNIITNYSNSNHLIDFDIKIKNILSLKTNGKLNKEKNEVIIK